MRYFLPFLPCCLSVFFVFLSLARDCVSQEKNHNHDHDGASTNTSLPPDFLTEQSVVLITGAAGFIGSELALALHRTYAPKRVLLVDRMVDHPQTQEELALFEFQRQRVFHVLQTLGQKGRFYRADFSPMIPEYFDLGEVPVLDHIFQEHPDITHVVHLADPYPHSVAIKHVVYRQKDIPKAGMMEALMEQLVKHRRERGYLPHFCYASSSEVYPFVFNTTTVTHITKESIPFDLLTETQPLSTPSSLRGASKMIDEMIAKLYYDTSGVYSVGLRFFSVYGPWGVPGSPVFEMAERAVTGVSALLDDLQEEEKRDGTKETNSFIQDWKKSIQDFIYIDDAVDAIMSAMQFRPRTHNKAESEIDDTGSHPHPVIFNVASGQGHSLDDIANIMREFFPSRRGVGESADASFKMPLVSVSIGSTLRAKSVLGYEPQVSLRDGIVKTLAWHYDRAFPYGGQKSKQSKGSRFIASKGIESCLPYDRECLRAAPVFPCASECSHKSQCTKSYYDVIIARTQSLTSDCETVLYTVDLDNSLSIIPSTHLQMQTTSKSFLRGDCNLAFVSEKSQLVESVKASNPILSFLATGRDKLLRNGAWNLIPLNIPSFPEGDMEGEVMRLLPKLSPGLFFGNNTKRAIYIDSNILLDSIPNLLREASTQPYSDEVEGATAMLIGRGTVEEKRAEREDESFGTTPQTLESARTQVQNAAYRMVRIAVADKLFGDGFMELLDSRWMVHTLQSDDARLFRCDVLGEVVQWEVGTDRSALEFVLGLHDMWSRVIAKSSGVSPWWIGDNVVTVPEGHAPRRRLQEDNENDEDDPNELESGDVGEESESVLVGDESLQEVLEAALANDRKIEGSDEGSRDENEETSENSAVKELEDAVDDDEIEEMDARNSGEDHEQAEFVLDAGTQQEVEADEEKRGESSEDSDDDDLVEGPKDDRQHDFSAERDYSSYDAWMGILSSSSTKYFVRICKSSEVGVASVDQ